MAFSSRLREHPVAPHLALMAVQLMFGTWPIFGKIALRAISSATLLTLRIVGAGVVFLLLKGSLAELPARLRLISTLQPLIAFALAARLLGESWTLRTLVASLLIFVGVFVLTKRGGEARRQKKSLSVLMRWRTRSEFSSLESGDLSPLWSVLARHHFA
jgi:drug/metabolite transporter (DMT)-like permease